MNYKKNLQEVIEAVKKESSSVTPVNARKRKSIYNTNLVVTGLTVPAMRKLNTFFSFYEKKPENIVKIWDYIWKNSSIFEVKSQAILYYEKQLSSLKYETHWNLFSGWLEQVDNWEHSDRLSRIYSYFLEKNPKEVYPILRSWNTSDHMWYRRQSVVSLLYYSNCRKKIIAKTKIFSLVKKLLKDQEYYVQKGVGWTLRETGNVYPKETLDFIQDHLYQISAVAFSAAVEKVNPEIKEVFKEKRRKFRKK